MWVTVLQSRKRDEHKNTHTYLYEVGICADFAFSRDANKLNNNWVEDGEWLSIHFLPFPSPPLGGPLTKQTVNKSVSINLIWDDLSKRCHLSLGGSLKGSSSAGATIFGYFFLLSIFSFPYHVHQRQTPRLLYSKRPTILMCFTGD